MSKKHFEAIAADIKDQVEGHRHMAATYDDEARTRHEYAILVLETTTESLAYTFRSFNVNFDRQRFLTACGF